MRRRIVERLTSRTTLFVGLAVAMVGFVGLLGAAAGGQEKATENTIPREDVDACMACHSEEMEGKHAVKLAALSASPHKDLKCQDCHSSIDAAPHTPAMLKEKAACATCHSEEMDAFSKSAHSKQDQAPGDHPTCASCHGGGDPHAVTPAKNRTRRDKIAQCSNCHRESARMDKYDVDTDAVPSYEESFHGKAFLRFGMQNAAVCTDCHRHHDVMPSSNPASPIHRNNAAVTCGQAGCHPGAQVNFAMSGANHLRLKVKEEPILRIEELFFRTLTMGTILFLLGGVVLDLRKKVFGKGAAPVSGRPVAFLICLSFLLVVATLLMAFFGIGGAEVSAVTAILILLLAYGLYFLRPKGPQDAHRKEKRYPRFTVIQRVHHGLLAVSFMLLVLTGLPLRFPDVEWLKHVYLVFGGLPGARIVHRVAACVLIGAWIWHTLFLLYRWKKAGFTFASWTMFPRWKDMQDFIGVSKYYLGLAKEEPKYDRFQFKEKFDYFAVYWGMPIMVFSGLVLWFPIFFGNRLPELGLSVAYIAHSDEAVLAFLVIVLWHFYNVHFSPDTFPRSSVIITGVKTRSEMEREHPLELERLESAEPDPGESAPPTPDKPAPKTEPDA